MAHCLEGKTITAVEIADDKMAMRFLIAGEEPIVAKADADCCSSSWIEHISLPAGGFPAVVLGVDDIELPGSTRDDENLDCLAVYGLKITTDKGELIIDYRNSSNGYYGGNLSWPDDGYFYGGVYGQNISTEVYQSVTSDI